MNGPLIITGQMPVAAASQTVPLFDSTAWNDSPHFTSTATTPGPGRSRAVLCGGRVSGNITPVGQGVTVTFESLLDPSATTNAGFGVDPNAPDAGTKVVAAGATYVFDWLPRFGDWRILVTNGATPPTTIASQVMITFDRNAGV
jgi:hypothetical protein